VEDISVTVPELTIQNPSQPLSSSSRKFSTTRPWHRIALGAIIALSAFLNFYRLDQMGYSNSYYAAGVKSMLMSWHNFFFVSFDPGGFVTIDKPPLGFWIQTASAKLFGFSGWSILFPEALAGVLAVALLYHLVRRTFGPVAGLIAALALAVTPVSVATQRNNTIDSLLVFTLLLSAWALIRAIETGRLRWLLLCALGIGLGFNIKMMEAYLVVPAFGLAYLLGTSQSWLKRILHLSLALILMLAVSFAWIVAVDLTPASQRPYVGSTQDNSELSLALGYNGVQRLLGMGGGGGGAPRNQGNADRQANNQQNPPAQQGNNQQNASARQGQQNPPNGGPGGGGPGGGAFGIGRAGLFRLFTDGQLSGQIAWMLPLAFIGLLVACWQERVRLPLSRKQRALVLWGVWLLTTYAFFSIAGFFHPYYLITFGPAIGALVGIGVVTLWNEYQRQSWWRALLLPLALIVTAAVQVYLLVGYPTQSSVLTPLVLVLCGLAVIVLGVMRFLPRLRLHSLVTYAVSVGLLAVLIAPTAWAAITVQGQGQGLPSAGPSGGGFGGGPGGQGGQRAFNQGGRSGNRQGNAQPQGGAPANGQDQSSSNGNKLEQYLLANQGKTRFILAVSSSQSADSLILDTGKPVMAMGGFSGSDPILTQQTVAELVANNTVRFFLLSGGSSSNQQTSQTTKGTSQTQAGPGGFGGGPDGGQSSVTTWVSSHCTTVATAQWQSQSQGQQGGFGGGPGGGSQQLYDCSNAK
jgi:4-amino-4-deoxy-L-arabinose transferase-like glycosyltransferase